MAADLRWEAEIDVGVVVAGKPQLLYVVDALSAASRLAGGLNGRQQQCDQHRNDRDNDKQLDQRETERNSSASHALDLPQSEKGCVGIN